MKKSKKKTVERRLNKFTSVFCIRPAFVSVVIVVFAEAERKAE